MHFHGSGGGVGARAAPESLKTYRVLHVHGLAGRVGDPGGTRIVENL